MTDKDDFIKNPVDGSPLLRPLTSISGIIAIIIVLYLFQHFKDTTDNKYVTDHEWKAGEGYNPGDWLSFDNSKYYKVQNDTLYIRDTAVAIIINIDKTIFGDNELKIKSIKTGRLGTYHEK